MLRSYSAELNGAELIWLDRPPANLTGVRVLVVIDDDTSPTQQAPIPVRYQLTDLLGRLQWRGDAVAAQRVQRDAW